MPRTEVAVIPGSFDPLTNGHMDLITRTLSIFDRVIVGVISNPAKSCLFTIEERMALIRGCCAAFGDRLAVGSFSGLLVDYLKQVGTLVMVRGLRAISDFDYEAQMALINKRLSPEVETFFLVAREENSYVSSSLVRQIAPLGGDVSKLVPPLVEAALKRKFFGDSAT
ncbi:MAG: pantetheine-phosphate adenylyltransferase [Deltaproteobacteria bacterium]|nr:pantetheine-phosphate adenylyltransferase [Deltaproteobacteria bacterium]